MHRSENCITYTCTIGVEILQDLNEVDIVITCVGGGGLISGLASFLKANNPSIEIWGAQTKNSPTFVRWFEEQETIPVKIAPSIAPGLSGPIEPGTITFPIIRDKVDRMIALSEDELVEGMRFMIENHQQVVEP